MVTVVSPVIFTRPGCGFCDEAKDWLRKRGIAFVERDLTQDHSAVEELERMGVYGEPAIVIDGQVMVEFNPQALEAALAESKKPAKQAREAAGTDQGP